jgi:hypothetical protein
MSRKWALLLVLMLISSMFFIFVPVRSMAAEPVRVYVDPPAVVDPGAFFNVSVKVENLVDLVGVQWSLTWDPTLLRAVNMTEIMFHEVTPQSEWDNIMGYSHTIDLGRAQYAYLFQDTLRAEERGYGPISGNHTMATITFQVLGLGNCPLQFIRWWTKLGNLYAEPIAHDVTDGFFSNSIPPIPPLSIEPPKVLIYVDPHRVRNESLAVGETFEVELRMDSLINNSGIVLSLFSLSWDSKLLKCIGLAVNQSWQYTEWRLIYNDLGECALAPSAGSIPPAQAVFGNLTLAKITFEVMGVGSCKLHLLSCWLEEASALGVQMSYVPHDGYFVNTLNGDLNSDNRVEIFDAIAFAGYFGTFRGCLGWNEGADMNGDGVVDIYDAIALCSCFGHTR